MVVRHDTITPEFAKLSLRERPTKMTFAQALKEKYVNQEIFDNELVLPKDKGISTDITFVGFGKVSNVQKQLYKLTSLDLSGRGIELAGNVEEFCGCLDRVQLLDLANNALSSWEEITYIVSCLPNLKDIIIANNPLSTEVLNSDSANPPQRTVMSLTMGRVYFDWATSIRILSHVWRKVDQLDMWDSNLCASKMILKSCEGSEFVRQIRVLKLSHNNFPDIDWLNSIGPIDNLVELDLSRCHLQSIDLDDRTVSQLKNLHTLNISYNDITSWRSIANLHQLRKLTSLICVENPIYILEKFARPFTISRIASLQILNRESISKSTRRDSEIFYMKKMLPEYLSYKEGKNDEFKLLHPRYEELADIYGLPQDLMEKRVADKYVLVDLCLDNRKITKKLSFDMTVANLRMLCKCLFKIKPSSIIQITCDSDTGDDALRYLLDQDGQTLDFFSVKNGQRLLIKEID